MQGKTVQIVSNNNSATENVYEKLSLPQYDLGFVAAILGSSENKKIFIEQQAPNYPDFSTWKTDENSNDLQKRIAEQSEQLKIVFDKQEKLACLKQELSQLVLLSQADPIGITVDIHIIGQIDLCLIFLANLFVDLKHLMIADWL